MEESIDEEKFEKYISYIQLSQNLNSNIKESNNKDNDHINNEINILKADIVKLKDKCLKNQQQLSKLYESIKRAKDSEINQKLKEQESYILSLRLQIHDEVQKHRDLKLQYREITSNGP